MRRMLSGLGVLTILSAGSCFKSSSRSSLKDVPEPAYTDSELEDIQTKINEKNSALQDILRSHGLLMAVRDQYFLGENGIAQLSTAWFTKQANWMDAWNPMINIVRGQTLKSSKNLDGLENSLKTHIKSLWELQQEFLSIRMRGLTALAELRKIEIPRPASLNAYKPILDNLDNSLKEMTTTMEDSVKVLSGRNLLTLEEIAEAFRVAAVERTKALAFNNPELDEEIAKVSAALAAAEEIGEQEAKLFKVFVKTKALISDGSIYAALDGLAALTRLEGEMSEALGARDDIPADFKASFLSTYKGFIADANNHFKNTIANDGSTADMFARVYEERRQELLTKCKSKLVRHKYDCSLARSVGRFKRSEVLGMDGATQKQIEATLIKALEGPIH